MRFRFFTRWPHEANKVDAQPAEILLREPAEKKNCRLGIADCRFWRLVPCEIPDLRAFVVTKPG